MEQYTIFIILIATLGLFIWGRWRYDVVALISLMAAVLCGAVPFASAFNGFSHPAVVTVAAVMVITAAIANSGVVDHAVNKLASVSNHMWLHVASLTIIAGILSAFMNNVGALGLIMPIAIKTAMKNGRSPAVVLMPIAFGSILGGMTTLIGTPPNILISTYRQELVGKPFGMFAFSPVGVSVAVLGILFIVILGWRLIPAARLKAKTEDVFNIQEYVTEMRITENSPLVEKPLSELAKISSGEYLILGLIRSDRRRLNIPESTMLQAGDVLLIEASSSELEQLTTLAKLELAEGEAVSTEMLRSEEIALIEAVVIPGSKVEGGTAQRLRLGSRYGINLLAIAREGESFKQRLKNIRLKAGDVLLLQGKAETLVETIAEIGFLPLAERDLRLGQVQPVFSPMAVFGCALLLVIFKLLPVQIAFTLAVLAMILLNIIPIRKVYTNIDWSVIILLGAMIPVGNALYTTGGTQVIVNFLLATAGQLPPIGLLGLILIVTMTLSDMMNNAATAVVMAPIAVTLAENYGYSVDPFLMTVAIGASCAFLTPIGHQNNTLVMGPCGYHFGDYWRMGLPLEILIIVTVLPLIMWIWPVV
jgi:di/tricarboxylate transporter